MRVKDKLFIDQYGSSWRADTLKDLREQIGGAVSKMYIDKQDGSIAHNGYVLAELWLTAFIWYEE